VAENLFDYNYTKRQRHTLPENRVYMGLVSYAIPVSFNFGQDAYLKPSVYYKKLPNQQSQLGITTLLNTNKYWVQAGYNDFYGFSGGLGGNFFKHLSVGVLAEFGNSSALEGIDPSFELLTTYSFGKKKIKVGPSEEDIKKKLAKSEAIAEKKALKQKAKQEKSRERFQKDSLLRLTRQLNSLALREKQMLKKNALKEKEREKFQKDSLLRRTKQANSLALQEKQKLKRYKDSLKTVRSSCGSER